MPFFKTLLFCFIFVSLQTRPCYENSEKSRNRKNVLRAETWTRTSKETEYRIWNQVRKATGKATLGGERGVELDEALKECQQEMQVYIEQLKVANDNHEQKFKPKISEVNIVSDIIVICSCLCELPFLLFYSFLRQTILSHDDWMDDLIIFTFGFSYMH